jgi:putative DNA primase/helicase
MNNTAAAPKPQAKISLPEITQKLHNVKKIAKGFSARCPNHDDAKNSLLLKEQPSGKITIDCMAGCRFNDVLARLDLKVKDLYPNEQTNGKKAEPKREIVKTYQYTDEADNLLYEVCRLEPKGFYQRRPHDDGGWIWALSEGEYAKQPNGDWKPVKAETPSTYLKDNFEEVRRVLYRLPELLNANKECLIFLCEGEKDADNLAAIGLLSTTNSKGAAAWRDEYTEILRESRVVICVDHDRAGIERGERLVEALSKADCQVQIFDPFRNEPIAEKHGKDISDWLEAGNTVEDLLALINSIELYEPESLNKQTDEQAEAKKENLVFAHSKIFNQIIQEIAPVNFREKAGLTSNQILPQKHLIVICIDELLRAVKAQNFSFARKHDFIFAFNGAFWKELDRELLKDFLGKVAEKLSVNELEAKHYEFREKLFKQFLASAYFEPIEQKDGTVLINLQNGTFEITAKNQTLRNFKADDFLTYQLGFEYNAAAKCPIFKEYLEKVLVEPELQNITAEFFGYVFTQNLKLEKSLLLYGSGANGKSVLFDVMNALLGRENISNFSLSDLLQEHNRALIANNLLNYGSEINATLTKDVFKNLVSNEPIQARLKYGNSFTMEKYAKLAFNCNELPRDIEQSNAYFRRLLIVPFRVTIPDDQQDKMLARKIIDNELSGVFNWILDGLKRLLKTLNFTQSDIVKKEVETYRKESDSVATFIDDENFVVDAEKYTTLKILYPKYRLYCVENGFKALGRNNFHNRLKALQIPCKRKNVGDVVYVIQS